MAIVLYGKEPAMEIKDQVKQKIIKNELTPELWVFTIGDDPASEVYLKGKQKDCEYCGIKFIHKKIEEKDPNDPFSSEFFIYADIDCCFGLYNKEYRDRVAKILQLPIPKRYNSNEIIKNLKYCDADGLSDLNVASFYNNTSDGMRPCTAEGIIRLLKYYGIYLSGKNVTIIGRSKIVGKPLSIMMSDEDATVTLCHSKTRDISQHTKNADIIVSAVGHPGLITPSMINTNSILIDVGINRTKDGKLVGDVDPSCYEKCSAYTPVPGGIGLMTRAILMENVYKIAKRARKYEGI